LRPLSDVSRAPFSRTALVTTVLVEQAGKTTLTTTALYPSQEVRDAVLNSPMERGVAEGYDMLAELLASTLARGDSQDGA